MNARIAKEIRAHQPVLVFILAGIVLGPALSAYYLHLEKEMLIGLLTVVYFVGCLLLGVVAFGNEFQHRTLVMLLSQPVAREKIWREKLLTLIMLGSAAFLIFAFSILNISGKPDGLWPFIVWMLEMLAVPVGVVCTAPYLTFVSKSIIGGTVFSACCPGLLLIVSNILSTWFERSGYDEKIHAHFPGLPSSDNLIFAALLCSYFIILYRLGYKKFLTLQIMDSQTSELNLPATFDRPFEKLSAAFSRPFVKLLFKELRLQGTGLLMSVCLCCLVLVEYIARFFNPALDQTIFDGTIMIYVLFFPSIIGVTAVAEEKAWGIKDWHLTLPPSVRLQWRAKWLVVFGFSLVLGLGLSVLFFFINPWRDGQNLNSNELQVILAICCFFPAVAMYAGSVCATSLRGLLLAFGLVTILACAFWQTVSAEPLGTGPMSLIVSVVSGIFRLILVAWSYLFYLVTCGPVWLLTRSESTVGAIQRWANEQRLAMILVLLGLCGCLWLVLRFARGNYRHSDLTKRHVATQIIVLILLAGLVGAVLNIADRLPYWWF